LKPDTAKQEQEAGKVKPELCRTTAPEEPPGCGAGIRIQRLLSAGGVSSRRGAEKLIISGRVTVNRIPVKLGQRVDPELDEIAVDGIPLAPAGDPVYLMLNKPRGYITTMNDERGRKSVMCLVGDAGVRVFPVGRLDMDSEGLLLMTNDGKFAHAVAHPSGNKTKIYEVCVEGDAAGSVTVLREPMVIDAVTIKADSVMLVKRQPSGGILRIAVFEGRNRQIRKMCAKCGLKVTSLKRVAIGNLELGSLRTGQWRHLTAEEVRFFG